jgi:hypothetical protein
VGLRGTPSAVSGMPLELARSLSDSEKKAYVAVAGMSLVDLGQAI